MTGDRTQFEHIIDFETQENYLKTLQKYATHYEEHTVDGNHLPGIENVIAYDIKSFQEKRLATLRAHWFRNMGRNYTKETFSKIVERFDWFTTIHFRSLVLASHDKSGGDSAAIG